MSMEHHHDSLSEDLDRMLASVATRRQSLRWLFAGAAIPLAGCGGATTDSASVASSSGSSGSTGGTTTTACSVIPEETGGPYPGDGTNRNASGVATALVLSGIVRSDIRASVAGATGVAAGIPLTVRLQLVNVAANCAAAGGAAVEQWHITRDRGD
jgi:hypothetical protein